MFIVGHRGARHEAPENTLAGFQHLRSLGIHRVELDLHLSKDLQLVVIHDPTLQRTIKLRRGLVSSYNASDLAKMESKQEELTQAMQFDSDLGIPTLSSVLENWPELQMIQLEVKPPSKQQIPIIAKLLGETIQQFSLQNTAIITSSNELFLAHSKERNPTISHGLVADRFKLRPLKICKRIPCNFLIANWSIITPHLVEAARLDDIQISSWTVNDVSEAERLSKLGIHSIISDSPSALRYLCSDTETNPNPLDTPL